VDARERFEALFRAHYTRVFRFVARRSAQAVVDDVVAETFLVAWRRLDDAPDDVLPWLLGVARRTLSTQQRSARRRAALGAKLADAHRAFEVEQAEAGGELGAAVVDALKRLGARDREAITLIAWEELTPAQAAVVLGVPRAAFRVRLHRAKRRLVQELERDPRVGAGSPVGAWVEGRSECWGAKA